MDRATANSSPRTATGHKQDDQIVKTKPLTRSCLRVLDQGLGPTRARSSRNRPLEQPRTKRLGCARVDWTSRQLTFHGTHVASHTRSGRWRAALGRALGESERCVWSHSSPLSKGRRTWFINASNKTLATGPFPAGMIGRSLRPQIRVQHERSGVVTAGDQFRRPLGLSCWMADGPTPRSRDIGVKTPNTA